MQSLRRFRKLLVLAALVWLPMSVFAQICATHAVASHLAGPQHSALIAPDGISASDAELAPLVAVDAAMFWQAVDDYDTCCDMQSVCAFAAMTALMSSATKLSVGNDTPIPLTREIAFLTRALTPDTPPPRL